MQIVPTQNLFCINVNHFAQMTIDSFAMQLFQKCCWRQIQLLIKLKNILIL